MHGFVDGNLKERDHLEDPRVDGRIILKWIFNQSRGRAWIVLIWVRAGKKRRALVKTVLDLHVPQKVWNFWTTETLLAFQEVPCSMQLVF